MTRPGFWRSLQSEDSAGNDIDAGRVVLIWSGFTIGVIGPCAMMGLSLLSVARGNPFDPMSFAGGLGTIAAGVAAQVTGGGAYMLMKGKGEGPTA